MQRPASSFACSFSKDKWSFITLATEVCYIFLIGLNLAYFIGKLYYKSFKNVVYDRNDSTIIIYDHISGQWYKTMILANLALARSINYDRKVSC